MFSVSRVVSMWPELESDRSRGAQRAAQHSYQGMASFRTYFFGLDVLTMD